ncbi:MAG: CpaF family protein [Clostridia bacterium]|nr:CpaF family protein [Clostridia bacterium]
MGLLERLEKEKTVQVPEGTSAPAPKASVVESYINVREKVHREVIEAVNQKLATGGKTTPGSKSATGGGAEPEVIRSLIEEAVGNEDSISRPEKARISKDIYDDVVGLGPLEQLLADTTVSEIMVNGPSHVYVERAGRISLTDVHFLSTEHLMNVIDRIVSPIGRHVDEASPMVDARLADGSRVNVVIPPLALKGPTVTIRKFAKIPLTMQDIIRSGSLSPFMARFLESCVRGRANIIVSGGTGSGKTTLLNILSCFIPASERIVTIEDAAELQLRQEHVVTLESRPANLEGKGVVSIRDLVRNALRMRPDRIVVGEVRSGEALDMLQAMNTGHEGSLTTAHANTPRDLLSRLETMVLMAGMELPVRAIREQISSAIDVIVQQSRFRDGTRKVTNISEVVGMEGDIITLQDIFVYEGDGTDPSGSLRGRYRATGIRPACAEKLRMNGASLSDEWFM